MTAASVTYLVTLDQTDWEMVETILNELTARLEQLVQSPAERSPDDRQQDIADINRVDRIRAKLSPRLSPAPTMYPLSEEEYGTYLDALQFGTKMVEQDLCRHPLLTATQQVERINRMHG